MVIALDFDGVICDSAGETALSGWEAAARIWPNEFKTNPSLTLINDFRFCRPVLETGYQSIIIMTLLCRGVSKEEIVNNFSELMDRFISEEKLSITNLVKCFGESRDLWINDDFQSWLDVHAFYPGVVQWVNKFVDRPVYIITTKEKRFASALVKAAGISTVNEIFGLESGKKSDVLRVLAAKHPSSQIHFFEDRLKTIISLNVPRVKSYLVDWGYNTESERSELKKHKNLEGISLPNFLRLFK